MRLQVSLDRVDIPTELKIMETLHDVADIAEVGTQVVMKEGLEAVRSLRKAYPDLTILADLKTMDGGEYAASIAFEAGADIVTILALASDSTIEGALRAARKYGKEVMADMISVADVEARAKQLDAMGVNYICVHTGVDMQKHGKTPMEDLGKLTACLKNSKAAVAGGIGLDSIADVVKYSPEIVISGKGVTAQPDMRAAALELKKYFQ
ncbi:MAG: D-arabino-3-hexulose 6-phosphate formaldehyde lyase [Clostridiales bacterium]|nr:D-arabino-3-hexulose 6-phosphate formaldehyde lyase [Clostridiales bacterium]